MIKAPVWWEDWEHRGHIYGCKPPLTLNEAILRPFSKDSLSLYP